MALVKVEVSIDGGTPESRELYGRIQRAIGLTERLNRTPYDDREAIRQSWIELTGTAVDETFHLIPPLYSDHGLNIRVGRNVFIGAGGSWPHRSLSNATCGSVLAQRSCRA